MDGYTYMIERNKLMIQQALERKSEGQQAPQAADAAAHERARLMKLYAKLEGCGREDRPDSE